MGNTKSDLAPAMKPNPGGPTRDFSRDTIGRDGLAASCSATLEVRSIVMAADRRIGKTWLLGKMGQEAPSGVAWIYLDAESAGTLGELLDRILDAARKQLHRRTRAFARTMEIAARAAGGTFGTFTMPALEGLWKKALSAIVDDLTESAGEGTVVLVLDEFPLLLHKLVEGDPAKGAQQAMELCDVLRSFRQTRPSLRMVLAGSIGLHLVMDDLRRRGYRNDPFNDMETIEVPPLSRTWAEELAQRLLRGIGISQGIGELAATIARESECVPYFIHRLSFEMQKASRETWAPADISALLSDLIVDHRDPLHLDNYRDRIEKYYRSKDEQQAVCTMLDVLAEKEEGVTLKELFDTACAAHPAVERSRMAKIAEMLAQDHYVRRCDNGEACAFASNILRSWWLHKREGVAGT